MASELTFCHCRLCGFGYHWPPLLAGILGPCTRPNPGLCPDCVSMEADRDEVTHEHALRCPKCGNVWVPDFEDGVWKEDDENWVCCNSCGHDFTVKTDITYTFTSPARLHEEDDDETRLRGR